MGPVGRVRRSRHPAKHGTLISETDAPAAPVAPAADVGAVCLRVADRGGAGEFDGVTLKKPARWRCAYRAYNVPYTLWVL
ncbi:hypothetical protein ACSN7O_001821 [Enterobacter chuandaensis]